MTRQHIDDACRAACEQVGIEYRRVPADNEFHYTKILDKPRDRDGGRIKLFSDQRGGIAWNWSAGQQQKFFINRQSGALLDETERNRIRAEQQRRQRERQDRQNQAASRACAIKSAAQPSPPDHPYLTKKRVQPHGVRMAAWHRHYRDNAGNYQKLLIENTLIVPMYNEKGLCRNLQAIFPKVVPELGRGKDFLPGGETGGLFWWIGAKKTNPILIAEGFATAATLHEETGYRVYIAFSAGNLLAAGRIVHKHLPDVKIIFCADNDENTPGNPGVTKATEAAAAIGAYVAIPPIAGDFNDYAAYIEGSL